MARKKKQKSTKVISFDQVPTPISALALSIKISLDDKRRVYHACKTFLRGIMGTTRDRKLLTTLNKHRAHLDVSLRGMDKAKVAWIVRVLCDQNVFQSMDRAKIRCPELFLESTPAMSRPSQLARVDEAEAATGPGTRESPIVLSDDEAVHNPDNVPSTDDGNRMLMPYSDPVPPPSSVTFELPRVAVDKLTTPASRLGPLPPPATTRSSNSSLPYDLQHYILTNTQSLLEECCFDFAKKWMPFLLKKNRWETAAAVEISVWMNVLAKPPLGTPMEALNSLAGLASHGCPVLYHVRQLRNIAVHRSSEPAHYIHTLVGSAVELARVLGDPVRQSKLNGVHTKLEEAIKTKAIFKRNLDTAKKAVFEQLAVLDRKAREIQEQREALDRKARELTDRIQHEDDHERAVEFIEKVLEDSVRSIFADEPKEGDGGGGEGGVGCITDESRLITAGPMAEGGGRELSEGEIVE